MTTLISFLFSSAPYYLGDKTKYMPYSPVYIQVYQIIHQDIQKIYNMLNSINEYLFP